MKKLVFMFAAFAAVSFASCGGNTTPAVEAETVDTIANDSCCQDSCCADSACADSLCNDSVCA